MTKFKVGDKVYIEAEVTEVDNNDLDLPYYVFPTTGDYGLWVGEENILYNIIAQLLPVDNISVGDGIKTRDFEGIEEVINVGEDVVHTTNWRVYKSSVTAIYKKSWEKKKSLEEMSKEELIAMIKKLKGEEDV